MENFNEIQEPIFESDVPKDKFADGTEEFRNDLLTGDGMTNSVSKKGGSGSEDSDVSPVEELILQAAKGAKASGKTESQAVLDMLNAIGKKPSGEDKPSKK